MFIQKLYEKVKMYLYTRHRSLRCDQSYDGNTTSSTMSDEAYDDDDDEPIMTTKTSSAIIEELYCSEDDVKGDPLKVDNILSHELLQLSLEERNAALEEIHGVHSNAVKETPELIAESFAQLKFELEEMIPPEKKQAYQKSQALPNTFVNTDSFRLRFLRCTLFDPTRAALEITKYLEYASILFGDIALQRPIRISDFSKAELRAFREGRLQFLPYGDRSGRRVFIIFPDEKWETFPLTTKAKMSLYLSWTAGDDVQTQRQGIVFLVWFSEAMNMKRGGMKIIKDRDIHSVRASAIHICSPDTPFHRLRRALVTMNVGPVARTQMKVHLGTSVEMRYILQSYGIPIDHIPISYSGTIKTGYARQWLRVRSAIEQSFDRGGNDDPTLNNIVEYPNFNDVVFRPGSSCVSHPGNSSFRTMVGSKLMEQDQGKEKSGTKMRRKDIVKYVVREIESRGGQFLVWNEIGGWSQLNDEKLITSKIESLLKEFRKSTRTKIRQETLCLRSGTSSFFQGSYYDPNCCKSLKE